MWRECSRPLTFVLGPLPRQLKHRVEEVFVVYVAVAMRVVRPIHGESCQRLFGIHVILVIPVVVERIYQAHVETHVLIVAQVVVACSKQRSFVSAVARVVVMVPTIRVDFFAHRLPPTAQLWDDDSLVPQRIVSESLAQNHGRDMLGGYNAGDVHGQAGRHPVSLSYEAPETVYSTPLGHPGRFCICVCTAAGCGLFV